MTTTWYPHFPDDPKKPKYPADQNRSCVDIEREAVAARERLGFDPEEPLLPSMAIFERLSRLRTGPQGIIPVDYQVDALPDGVEGDTSYSPERKEIVVTLSPQTFEALEQDVPRARYSAAHETGHVVQHSAEVIRLSRIPHRTVALLRGSYERLKPFEDAEWQANTFAGALLMPANALWFLEKRGRLDVEIVRRRFGASLPCVEIRLRTYEKHKEKLVK